MVWRIQSLASRHAGEPAPRHAGPYPIPAHEPGHVLAIPASRRYAGRFELINRTGYDTGDLRRFCESGMKALGIKGRKTIMFVAAPQRSRGCAEVPPTKGESPAFGKVVIAMAAPHRFSMRRLARLFQHEMRHSQGYEHSEMTHDEMWSLGPVPTWAERLKIRYRGRAPNQIIPPYGGMKN